MKYITKKIERKNITKPSISSTNIKNIIASCEQIQIIDQKILKNTAIQLPNLFSHKQL